MKKASRKIPKADSKLDALFDYTKIRPPIVVLDDDDDVQELAPSKLSTSGRPLTGDNVEVTNCEEKLVPQGGEAAKVINDNDWLELPPTKPKCHRVLPSDPTLLKLRQQKEELQMIWQASEASVKNMEEAARMEARATPAVVSQQPGAGTRENAGLDAVSGQAPSKRQKILLKLQGETGESHGVRIFVDDKLEKLFTHYAKNIGRRPITDFVFRFDGQQLKANSSPKDMDLEDEDIVEVFVKGAQR